MIKNFYKRKKTVKVFFAPSINLRSLAYGEDVKASFLSWQEYFYSRWGTGSGSFVLSAQGNIAGNGKIESDLSQSKTLPTLTLDSVRYEVQKDGLVTTNGKKTALNIGTELKAWTIASVPTSKGIINSILVIGKPKGETTTKLACYEIATLAPTGKKITCLEFPMTLDNSSYIIALGRHIFSVHNSQLFYYYYNLEEKQLEEVGIATDESHSEQDWCKYVSKNIVADKSGGVFWIAGGKVYGIKIGFPKELISLPIDLSEEAISVRADGTAVVVSIKDRNTGKINESRYRDTGDGYAKVLTPNGWVRK